MSPMDLFGSFTIQLQQSPGQGQSSGGMGLYVCAQDTAKDGCNGHSARQYQLGFWGSMSCSCALSPAYSGESLWVACTAAWALPGDLGGAVMASTKRQCLGGALVVPMAQCTLGRSILWPFG